MPELDQELAHTIEDLITQSYTVYDKENLEPSLTLLKKAWDLLPSSKVNWQESYYISKNIIHTYLQADDLEKVKAYLPTFITCDNLNRNYGESEFLAGKIAFDTGKKTEALNYFVIAGHKGGSRIFNGSENARYKDFYKKHPDTADKTKAYKASLKPQKISVKIKTLIANDYTVFRQLEHPDSGKICTIAHQEQEVLIELGKSDKTKITGKKFPSKDAASLHWKKKEVELLKKGFIYKNPNANLGAATMHRFIGSGYTGALSFEPTTEGIYVSKVCWDNNTPKDAIKDALVLIDEAGLLIDTINLPKALPWDICYNATQHLLYIYLDKRIYEYNIVTKVMLPLTKIDDLEHKRVTSTKNALAFSTKNDLKFTNNLLTIHEGLFNFLVSRDNPSFAFQLSPDGQLLAVQQQAQVINIMNTQTGFTTMTLDINTAAVGQIEISPDNKILTFIDHSADYWQIRFFSLETQKELFFEEIKLPPHEHLFYFCYDATHSKLVLNYRTNALVFDFQEKKFLHEFQFEHSVKKGSIKFVGELLGVRTDYGFFSLYKV